MAADEDEPAADGRPAAGDPFSLADLVIPDDLRELDADLRALRRERRAKARRDRLRRLFLGRGRQRFGASAPIVIGVLLVVAGFASLMLLFQPRRPQSGPASLAASGVRNVGQEGGLLPKLLVRRADGDVPLRDYRPAVIALLPADCRCDSQLVQAGIAAGRHHLDVLLLAAQLPPLPAGMPSAGIYRGVDLAGEVGRTYHLVHDPILLLVRGDGVVNRILDRSTSDSALDGELAVLSATGAWSNTG